MPKNVFLNTGEITADKLGRFNYLVCKNGVFKVEKTMTGIFSRKATEKEIAKNITFYNDIDRSLLLDGAEGFSFALPKIPFDIIAQIISFFRVYADDKKPFEAMACIYWNPYEEKYFVDVPEHTVSKVRIDYVPLIHSDAHLVMQLHSHHHMMPLFSSIDDANHVETGLYGVVGNIGFFHPKICIRASCSGSFTYLEPENIIESPYVGYKKEWEKKIKYF